MERRQVQGYIEEVPRWSSGDDLAGPPLSSMQWLVWLLASAGKFFEGFIVFIGGIACRWSRGIPLNAAERGLRRLLFGIRRCWCWAVGGSLGAQTGLHRRDAPAVAGRRCGLRPSPACCWSVCSWWGWPWRGPHGIEISESIPSAIRGRLVLGAFSFQALGALAATALGIGVLLVSPELQAWRSFYVLPVIPVALVAWGRLLLPESSHWLASRGDLRGAEQQLGLLLNRSDVDLHATEGASAAQGSWRELFQGRLLRATVLASVPWFLQDISTYGIGIFTPVIIGAVFGAELGGHSVSAVIHDDLLGAKGAALVDLAFVAGIAVAIALADRWGRITLQIVGFIGCAIGLAFAALGSGDGPFGQSLPLILAGFVVLGSVMSAQCPDLSVGW